MHVLNCIGQIPCCQQENTKRQNNIVVKMMRIGTVIATSHRTFPRCGWKSAICIKTEQTSSPLTKSPAKQLVFCPSTHFGLPSIALKCMTAWLVYWNQPQARRSCSTRAVGHSGIGTCHCGHNHDPAMPNNPWPHGLSRSPTNMQCMMVLKVQSHTGCGSA